MDARDFRQQEAIQSIAFNNYNAAILASVGFGKGKVLCQSLLNLKKEKGLKSVLYLCDNQRLRDVDFPAELKKWAPELIPFVRLECYQTVYKWLEKEYDMIIGDEFDFAITKEYIKSFLNIKSKYRILVSGTISVDKRNIINQIVPIVYEYTTNKAVSEKVLNKTNYYVYNYKMSEKESEEYLKWTKAITKAHAAEQVPTTIQYFQGKRKELLATLESSASHVERVKKWMYSKNKNSRIVLFCERTTQADRVCQNSYHGGNTKLDNLNRFQAKEVNEISVVGKIKRGINLKDVNCGIFEMLGGSSTTEFQQRDGRLKRLPIDQVATVVVMIPWYLTTDKDNNPVYVQSIVEEWRRKATSNLKVVFENLKF